MRACGLQNALETLSEAIREVEVALEEMRSEQDPLAAHMFVSRRQFCKTHDTKSGKRREINARLSWQQACELGFRSNLNEWERLMGAVAMR